MNIFKEFKYMLSSDDSDKFSSKRVITFLAFLLISGAFLANMISGVSINENMFDGMIQIVFVGLGVTVGEHLLKKKNGDNAVAQDAVVLSAPEVTDETEETEETELKDEFGNVIEPKESDEDLGDN
tara:strand:- start:1098 stop:1475 length:378 start_codon:yes stop_codon:yes gene_type:complete